MTNAKRGRPRKEAETVVLPATTVDPVKLMEPTSTVNFVIEHDEFAEANLAQHASNIEQAVAAFRKHCPMAWNDLRLCPLQHGVDDMIALLRYTSGVKG